MAYFNPKTTRVYRAVLIGRLFPKRILRPLVTIGIAAVVVSGVLWAIGYSMPGIWHLFVASAFITYVLWVYTIFFESYLDMTPPPKKDDQNLADFLDYQAMVVTTSFSSGDISRLLLPMLDLKGFSFVVSRIGISKHEFEKQLHSYLHTHQNATSDIDLVSFLGECLANKKAKQQVSDVLTWRDLFLGLCTHSDFLKKLIFDLRIETEDVASVLDWQKQDYKQRENTFSFWKRGNLLQTRGIGHDWASGYTNRLEKYAIDITTMSAYAGMSSRVYGRKEETEQIERVLSRDGKNNAVLVGEDGVGKTVIISALAKRLSLGQTHSSIAHKHILKLDVGALLSGSSDVRDIEQRLRFVLSDAARAGNVILFIENIHTLFDSSQAAGVVDASEILLPFLMSSRVQVIGTTTPSDYHKTIANDSGLMQSLEKVNIEEPSKENVYKILRDIVPHIEAYNSVWILFQAIRGAVELSDRYVKNVPFPEKAIDLLQESSVYATTKRQSGVVEITDVEAVLERRTGIPVGVSTVHEREKLLSLEEDLHKRVIGQDGAIVAIANAMRRARSGVSSEKKPIGGFLFIGPTGVGKTETAKALSETYFGSEEKMIRFDMSEYQDETSISRLIGHGNEGGLLTTQIIDKPFSLVLLDEIEKAHPKILDIFLQVLDDGRLTDSVGRTADFTNSIIIATSNAGAEMIRESATEGTDVLEKKSVLDQLQKRGIFRPEFLNRFDAIVMFRPITKDQEKQIATLMLEKLNERLNEKGVSVTIEDAALERILSMGFSKEYGARPLRRVLQDTVENIISKKILSGELERGSTLVLTEDML